MGELSAKTSGVASQTRTISITSLASTVLTDLAVAIFAGFANSRLSNLLAQETVASFARIRHCLAVKYRVSSRANICAVRSLQAGFTVAVDALLAFTSVAFFAGFDDSEMTVGV